MPTRKPLLTLLLMMSPLLGAASDRHCFGAMGPGCGESGGPAYCRPALASSELECIVNAGSIEHDGCCFRHPDGQGCGGRPPASSYCQYEWDKAQSRTRHGLYWTRRVNPREANTGGQVDFQNYCAPSGSVIAAGDDRYCCSRTAVAIDERDPQGANKLRCH